MPGLVVLLPPSEGKATGGDGPSWQEQAMAFPSLDPSRRRVGRALRAALRSRAVDNAALLGVKGPALAVAVHAGQSVDVAATLPALERYTGVLYDALGYATLSAAARRRADEALVVVSGLWGLLTPADRIPDYKAPIGVSLPGLGRLATWWRPRLSPVLDAHVHGAVVWDLLPGAHAAAWHEGSAKGAGAAARWQVRVLREDAGRRTTVSHDNKSIKGALARHLLTAGVSHPCDLRDWQGPGGYRLDLSTSTLGERGGVVDLVQTGGSVQTGDTA